MFDKLKFDLQWMKATFNAKKFLKTNPSDDRLVEEYETIWRIQYINPHASKKIRQDATAWDIVLSNEITRRGIKYSPIEKYGFPFPRVA